MDELVEPSAQPTHGRQFQRVLAIREETDRFCRGVQQELDSLASLLEQMRACGGQSVRSEAQRLLNIVDEESVTSVRIESKQSQESVEPATRLMALREQLAGQVRELADVEDETQPVQESGRS